MNDRKQLLQQKLKATKQKISRKELIELLPDNLSVVIEEATFFTDPKVEHILNNLYNLWNNELHLHSFINKYSENRKEFSWENEVISFVQGLNFKQELGYLYVGIEKSPLYLVGGKWLIENFDVFWEQISFEDIWFFGKDLSNGVLVSQYGGYLEHDPNPKEIMYAITYWGIDK
ncbi:hypothetical protein LC087_16435 [Bacillus carboniphilus]|uniref:Uncharacterized protein n=1 Tax=Bacillus carboniphilus TaxID=86663 RepID=A0ABY9JXE2_9BACI|nr:hypothetical protein [Bacillus carboniphilus]WLR42290.1 hypothetical protein LC087_16435 [Bacillus carboniphilus]